MSDAPGIFDGPEKDPAISEQDTPAIIQGKQNWYHDKQTDRFYLYGSDKTQIAVLQRGENGFALSTRDYDTTEWTEQGDVADWDEAFKAAEEHNERYQKDFEAREYRERRLAEQRDINEQERQVSDSGIFKSRSPKV